MKKIECLLLFIAMATSALAQQVAGTGKTGPNGSMIGYNAAGLDWLYVPVDANGYILVDCPGCTGGSGTPGGSNTQIQFNDSGAFGGSGAFTYDKTTATVTLASPSGTFGTAGVLQFTAPYSTGSGTATDIYKQYIQIGSGVNPFSQWVFDHPSGSPSGGEYLFVPAVHFASGVFVENGSVLNISALIPSSHVCTDSLDNLSTLGCTGGGGGAGVATPKDFGGFGDAIQIPNGCTTNGTTTVVCPAGPFVSGDVGKQLWVGGAGAAGVAFGATITAFTSSTTVTVSAIPATNVTQNYSVFGHDDVVAIQSCINASALSGEECFLGAANPNLFLTASGWLVASAGLLIPTHANIAGSSMYGGSSILSEFNGDTFSLTQGTSSLFAGQPVSGVNVHDLGIYEDQTQPNSRGYHINSAAGLFGFGGMYYSTFQNINVENAALECFWLDGHTFSNDNPNQYLTINNLVCDGPNQMHTANEIRITGVQAQIQFENGAINGINQSNYPNPLIYIGEKTSGQGDSPGAVSFFNYTYEVGTKGLYVGNGSQNIHFENGYVEQVASPLIVQDSVQGLTYKGNHLANSGNVGAVVQASNSTGVVQTATISDNQVAGSSPSPAAFAVCSGSTNNFAFDFGNNISSPSNTSNCATNHIGTGAALFQGTGTTVTVDPSSQAINLIKDANVPPGKTLTMYALSGGVGSFSLASGGTPSGNAYPINLGAYASPLVVTAGNSVVLALLDQGSFQWTVVGGTALGNIAPASVLASGIVDGQAPLTITTGASATLGGTYSSGYTINHEATAATAVTYTLPTAAAGKQYCVKNGNNGSAADTGILTLQVSAAGQSIIYNGTAGASNGNLVSGGAAGDAACVVGISATQWEAYAQVGSWVVH